MALQVAYSNGSTAFPGPRSDKQDSSLLLRATAC